MKPSAPKDIARVIFQKYDLHVSSDSVNLLSDLLELHKLKYRTAIQKPGDMVSRFYYIESGLVKVSHNDANDSDTEIVDDIFKE